MRLVNSAPDLVEFRGRDAVRAPLWVGVGLLLGPSALSLFGPAPFTPVHVVGAITLVALGVGLLALGWPRARWARIRTGPRTVASSESTERPLADGLTVRLVAVPTRGSSGNALYGIAIDDEKTAPTLLIARQDPGEALVDLGALRAKIPFPVVGGWGLPGDAPWVDVPAPLDQGSARLAPWDDRAARRPIATTLFVGALVIGVAIGLEIRTRLALGDSAAWVSMELPILGLALLLGVTLALATHDVRLALGSDLSCERRIYGLTYARARLEKNAIRKAYLVSPSGHHARHLLLDTEGGPFAFPCDDVIGTKMVSDIARARGA